MHNAATFSQLHIPKYTIYLRLGIKTTAIPRRKCAHHCHAPRLFPRAQSGLETLDTNLLCPIKPLLTQTDMPEVWMNSFRFS